MRIEPARRKGESCHNGCMARSDKTTDGYFRTATHAAWLLDRPTYLCGPCAKNWRTMYDDALEGP